MSRLYLNAAQIVQAVEEKKQSLKKICHGKGAVKIGKMEYLLACETLKYSDVIDSLYKDSNIDKSTLDVSESLLKVMTYEIIFGKGKVQGGGYVKRKLLEIADCLQSTLSAQMIRKNVTTHEKLLSQNIQLASSLMKYIRINEIAVPISEAFELIKAAYPAAELDSHIASLVSLPPNTSGIADFVKKHKVAHAAAAGMGADDGLVSSFIIQDKASCMPAQVLFDEYKANFNGKKKTSRRTDFIDACAAPGNKTSHLASLLYTHSHQDYDANTVYAFDKSMTRSKLLNDRMMAAGALNVTVQNYDFLEVDVDADEYSSVKYLLLDPSCSGSGVVRALERVLETENGLEDSENKYDSLRLKRLQEFQIQVIAKAMSFPAAEYIVYSTCSIHNEENEDVVQKILEGFPDWDVQLPSCLRTWHRRGLSTQGLSEVQQSTLIRCQPDDGMNGFFVALFKKMRNIGSGSTSRVTFEYSPPPAISSADSSDRNNTRRNKRKCHEDVDTRFNKKGNSSDNNKSSVSITEKNAKKVKGGRVLTVWKPRKRR